MKRFLKLLFPVSLTAFVFALFLYADSYPGNFTKPNPGGAATLWNYATAMPVARIDPSFSNAPYPTNKWFTSLFASPVNSATAFSYHYGNKISPSPMVVIYDTEFPYTSGTSMTNAGMGYLVGGHIFKKLNNNQIMASNAMAFSVQCSTGTGVNDVIAARNTLLKSYNDWSFTAVLQDIVDPSRKMTSTFGKGFVFTYNYFSNGVNPRLKVRYLSSGSFSNFYYNNGGTMMQITPGMTVSTDCIIVKSYIVSPELTNQPTYQYFGVYAPPGSTFKLSANGQICDITLSGASESERYLSIGLLKSPMPSPDDSGAFAVFNDYYRYAYNFITNTQVNWSYNQSQSALTTNFNFTMEAKRTGAGFAVNQTVFALYPHQWKNMAGTPNKSYTYNSIRGLMKVHSGSSFSTNNNFNGIVPFLTYEVSSSTAISKMQQYVDYDKNFDPKIARSQNTYYYGKSLSRAANLISVFNQHGNFKARDDMIERIKEELAIWYSGGNGSKRFAYDPSWGGIIGIAPAVTDEFGIKYYNDHHFHYGYFVYASAILAMYDPEFAKSTQYKGMVDLLIREINNPYRNDLSFPFLRGFDVYEGHSYANGRGGGNRDFGNDEESTSEAMNAWAGIYLWGLATGNQDWVNLAVYGYTTQYESVKNYYFNMDGDIWDKSDYTHSSVGILYECGYAWSLFWTPVITHTVMGIQIMPLTPSMLYLGYDTNYIRSFYDEMRASDNGTYNNFWKDIWLRCKALFDGAGALADWDSANLPANFPDTWSSSGLGDDGSSLSFSYHFINFFNAMGTVDTGYYADASSFLVMNKNGTRTFMAYNPDKTNPKTVHFYKRSSSPGPSVPNGGTVTIPPGSMAKTQNFTDFQYFTTDVSNAEPVRESDTYSVYSDNFLGALWGAVGHSDRVEWYPWSGTATSQVYSSTSCAGSFEGQSYMSVRRTGGGWGAWAFTYFNGVRKDLSAYHGGTLEVSLRIDAPSNVAGGFEIGIEGTGGAQIWKPIGQYGFNQSLTTWQTVIIPLTNAQGITAALLQAVASPFIMRHNTGSSAGEWGINVYVDSIVWKKANPSAYFYADLRKRSDDSMASANSSLGWNHLTDYKRENAVSGQYVEISLNHTVGNSWGIQLYSDNKGAVTSFEYPYTGNIDSNTVSGLVNTKNRSAEMLPMKWRAAPSSIPDSDVFLPAWQDPWIYLRDVSAFNVSTGLYNGCNEIKFMDRKGFKYNGRDYGALEGNKKIKLYFIADFMNAKKNVTYKSNIIIEYFNE